MKKVLLVCFVAISAIAFATAGNSTGNVTSANINQSYQDTVPKRDTVPLPDTTQIPPSSESLNLGS